MSWYNGSWSKRLPVTVDNTGNATSALSYYQVSVTISGAAYAAWSATGNADGSDIRVTDSDGVTLLSHALEGIDAVNSVVYLLVKVPAVAAASTKSIYVYYGNAGATTVSSYATTVGPTATPSAPVDIYTQSDTAGYNFSARIVVLSHQTGGNASHNGDVLIFAVAGGVNNNAADSKLLQMRSTDNAATWSKALTNPVSGSAFVLRAAGELLDGTIVIAYDYDTNANITAAKAKTYIAKSTDAGVTWTNLSTSPTSPLNVPWTVNSDVGAAWGNIQNQTAGGLAFMTVYGAPSGSPRFTSYLLSCPGGSDPTNGSNWSTRGTIATDGTISYGEPFVIQTTDSNHYVAVMRLGSAPWDLYRSASTDGGVTWSTPTAVGVATSGTPGSSNLPTSPWIIKLASGNYALFIGSRMGSTNWGSSCLVSTDGCATFVDRPLPQLMLHTAEIASAEFGNPSAGIMANGKILWSDYHSAGTLNQVNIETCIVDEDYLVNGANAYDGCESFGALWTNGADATVSTTHVHSGTNAFKIDNSTGVNDYAVWLPWSANLGARGPKIAYSCWIYSTQIDVLGVTWSVADDQGLVSNNTMVHRAITRQDASPYHIKVYNGVSQVDLGTVAPINQWNKMTVLANCGASSSAIKIALNDIVLTNSLTNTQAGNAPYRLNFQGPSRGATHNTTFWLDDVYTHQYTPNIPTVSIGTEQTNPPTNKSTHVALILMGRAV